jgi:hypothetical protein
VLFILHFLLFLLIFPLFSHCHCCPYSYCYSLTLPSPGWTLLCFYDLRSDLPGCRRTGIAPMGLRHPRGLVIFGTVPGNAPNTYSTPGLFNLWSFTSRLVPEVLASLPVTIVPGGFASRATSPLPWPPRLGTLCFHHP